MAARSLHGWIPARSARAPVAFQLREKAPPSRIPAGTKLTADAPPGQSQPVSFETEQTVGVSAAKLVEVVSFWPGRDQYIDHSADAIARRPFRAFRRADLINTPHELYLGHDTLLALAGKVTLLVGVELATLGTQQLAHIWEYWDGQVWRAFKDLNETCSETASGGRTAPRDLPAMGRSCWRRTSPRRRERA